MVINNTAFFRSIVLLLPMMASLGFMAPPKSAHGRVTQASTTMTTTTTSLAGIINNNLSMVGVSGKYFQIEEMEDRERCTTEVLLNADASVSLLQTDGPLHKKASGSWKFLPNGMFEMTLTRFFDAGQPSKEPTKLGLFQFSTTRVFRGNMAHVGAKTSMEGTIIDVSSVDGEERSVGFFEMIDSTPEGVDWRAMGRSAASR